MLNKNKKVMRKHRVKLWLNNNMKGNKKVKAVHKN